MIERHPSVALIIIMSTLIIQILSAAILKYTADMRLSLNAVSIFGIIFTVAMLNLLRFGLWGLAHRWFPLSRTYPLTALFFPIILVISILFGETISANQYIGVIIITIGILLLKENRKREI